MKYYIVEKNDPSTCLGITTPKEVMSELGLSNAEFTKFVRNEEIYKGGILIGMEQNEKRYVSSEDEEEWRLFRTSQRYDYYVSNKLRIIRKSKCSGVEEECLLHKEKRRDGKVYLFVRIGRNRVSVLKEAYKAFINGDTRNDCVAFCRGKIKLENIEIGKRGTPKGKSVICNGIKYESIKKCAKTIGYSPSHVALMANGKRTNVIGVKYCN